MWTTTAIWRGRGRPVRASAVSFCGRRQPLLNSPGQFVLPLGRHEGLLARHLQVGVAGDVGGLDGAAADLLSPSDVGAAERVRTRTREVAAHRSRGRVQRLPDARVPHWLLRVVLLGEDPSVLMGDLLHLHPRAALLDKVAQRERAVATLRLGLVHVAVPDALLDGDGAGIQIQVLQLWSQDFR